MIKKTIKKREIFKLGPVYYAMLTALNNSTHNLFKNIYASVSMLNKQFDCSISVTDCSNKLYMSILI